MKSNNRQKIDCLKQYKQLEKEIIENEQRYLELKTKLQSPGISKITDMPTGSRNNNDTLCDGMSEIIEIEKLMSKQQKKLYAIRNNIQSSINTLPDSLHRRIMNARYIDGQSWEQVCVTVSYSWTNTHREHSKALKEINLIF